MALQNHVKRLEIKSLQRRDLCLNPDRNGRSKTGSGGGRHHPPTLLGLTLKKPWGGGIKTQPIWGLPLAR